MLAPPAPAPVTNTVDNGAADVGVSARCNCTLSFASTSNTSNTVQSQGKRKLTSDLSDSPRASSRARLNEEADEQLLGLTVRAPRPRRFVPSTAAELCFSPRQRAGSQHEEPCTPRACSTADTTFVCPPAPRKPQGQYELPPPPPSTASWACPMASDLAFSLSLQASMDTLTRTTPWSSPYSCGAVHRGVPLPSLQGYAMSLPPGSFSAAAPVPGSSPKSTRFRGQLCHGRWTFSQMGPSLDLSPSRCTSDTLGNAAAAAAYTAGTAAGTPWCLRPAATTPTASTPAFRLPAVSAARCRALFPTEPCMDDGQMQLDEEMLPCTPSGLPSTCTVTHHHTSQGAQVGSHQQQACRAAHPASARANAGSQMPSEMAVPPSTCTANPSPPCTANLLGNIPSLKAPIPVIGSSIKAPRNAVLALQLSPKSPLPASDLQVLSMATPLILPDRRLLPQ